MKKYIFAFIGILALVACDGPKSDDGKITRQCGDYLVEMEFNEAGDAMHAVINGDAVDLAAAVSASGSRYVGVLNDTDVTLWGQGTAWTLFLGDDAPIECGTK